MAIDATFWVAVSFFIFVAVLVYFKIPQKVNETLNKLISDIKNEIDESEKLRAESKVMLDNAQAKLESAKSEVKEISDRAKQDSEKLIIEMNDKFHKISDIKKNLAKSKISQMKEAALNDIKKASISIAVDSVKKAISTSVDKSKLDNLFSKDLEQTKSLLKKINS
jgi:F-type H+-transporting ATPase subunit b